MTGSIHMLDEEGFARDLNENVVHAEAGGAVSHAVDRFASS
ncbi:hypothetical protein [Corynebacterium sputi]|nr:hypothetical protein [Corynebacterium sputi]